MAVFVFAVSTALIVSFLCSVFESVLLSLGHARIEALDKKGQKAGAILKEFKKHIDVPIAAILILNTIAHTVGASLAGASYITVFSESTLWIFTAIFTVAILVFTEIVPKTLGITFSKKLAEPVALAVYGLVIVLKPVLFLTQGLSGLMRRGKKDPITSIEEIRLLAALGHDEGVVGSRSAMIIEGAARLRELTVGDVMVPRNRVVYISAQQSLDDNLKRMKKSGHSRFPFTKTNELDDVSGVVLVKELLFQLQQSPGEVEWDKLSDEPLLVPESGRLNDLLKTFQEQRRHLAMVLNEYGGIDGIVTLEDVLEEIVGEIDDESDRSFDFVTRRGDRLSCHGLAEARKVFEMLGIEEETEAVTLSGFLSEHLGDIPKTGDVLDFGGFRFEVVKASDRQAETVEVGRLPSKRD